MKNLFKRIIYSILELILFIITHIILSIPWILLGSIIYYFRWLFTGKKNGISIYIGAPLEFAIQMGIVLDDTFFSEHSFKGNVKYMWRKLKEEYYSD